ncbi:hypothetical protein VTJ49DRAFT_2730 [Mycothermus thermophilus]|uniref:Aprataxin C2HE/C2H2/C2HC zinc finger domain-containing protein n=1 Tax=Humicola insolens TaxID=85995 RepID=A0ABR3VMP8_HUMIN
MAGKHPKPELAEDEQDFTHQPDEPPISTAESPDSMPSKPKPKKEKEIRNAFTELMAPKPKPIHQPSPSMASKASQVKKNGIWRGALGEYTTHPERFPPNVVIRYTEHTVLIRDTFPKATVHLLLLPRSEEHSLRHPTAALSEDPEFLEIVKREADEAVRLAAAELERKVGSFSAANKARYEAMARGDPPDSWPRGRDWTKDVRVGTHAHPSMAHLHVHIISRDMHSEKMKHRKHYNSFNTPFFVPLGEYPLAEDDVRRDTGFQNGNLMAELRCWRCGREFGNRFAELKRHLEEEFEAWRAE